MGINLLHPSFQLPGMGIKNQGDEPINQESNKLENNQNPPWNQISGNGLKNLGDLPFDSEPTSDPDDDDDQIQVHKDPQKCDFTYVPARKLEEMKNSEPSDGEEKMDEYVREKCPEIDHPKILKGCRYNLIQRIIEAYDIDPKSEEDQERYWFVRIAMRGGLFSFFG